MAFILGAAPAHAGPCTDRIYQTDLDVAKLLELRRRSRGGRRPNRHSPPCIASRLRGRSPAPNNKRAISPASEVQAITEAMDVARHADDEGDRDGCEKALSDVDRMLKR